MTPIMVPSAEVRGAETASRSSPVEELRPCQKLIFRSEMALSTSAEPEDAPEGIPLEEITIRPWGLRNYGS